MSDAPSSKICATCAVEKPIEDFNFVGRGKKYRGKHCKPCQGRRAYAARKAKLSPSPTVAATGPVERNLSPAPGPVPPPGGGLDRFGLPPKDLNGKPNAAYYRAFYGKLNELLLSSVIEGGKIPFQYDAAMKGVDKEAEAAGFIPSELRDQRAPEQVALEFARKIEELPDSFYEKVEAVHDAVDFAMNMADTHCMEMIEGRRVEAIPKRFRSLLEKIRRLRDRAKNPIPKTTVDGKGVWMGDARRLTASWPLRVMAYCGRSNMAQAKEDALSVYMICPHHAKMAVDVWEAQNGVRYAALPNAKLKALGLPPGNADTKVLYDEVNYKGCILICPPGHGKTEMGRFIMACRLIQNPKRQIMMGHAQANEAEKNLAYLASLFSSETPTGRRCISLFGIEIEQRNAETFRLKLDDRLRQATCFAGGIKAKVSGANASDIWLDDPVDQKEAEQETERKRTFDLVNGTWFTRIRGRKNTFILITATLWHHADTVAKLIDLASKGKAMFRVSKQRCGGPKTTPQFYPLWPEVYDAQELRSRFDTMKNPSLWSAAYMGNPLADERKIVRDLRLYDPLTDEHLSFLDNSVKYMSLDPSATRGERADLAGLIYAGFGTVRITRMEDNHAVNATENRLRLIECNAIPATQSELVEHTINLSSRRSVDYILVETRSGFHGTADMFENYHGIDVVRLDPKNKNKEERLRAAAPAMEHGNASLGLHAVVEFPGVHTGKVTSDGHPILKLDPRFEGLADEILSFGFCSTDHMLDALTQLVNFLAPDLGIGTGGVVTKTVIQSRQLASDPHLLKLLSGWEKKKSSSGRIEKEESEWIGNQDSWRMPRRDVFPQG